MENASLLQNILSQVKLLNYENRLYLMERLAKQLRFSKTEDKLPSQNLSDLSKLSSDIWHNVQPDKYLKEQREWE